MTSPSLAYQDAMNGIAILYDALSDAENELDKLKNPWIKCSDRLPEIGDNYMSETVLVFYGEIGSININCMMGDRWLLNSDDVTHWMPLPQPPEDE